MHRKSKRSIGCCSDHILWWWILYCESSFLGSNFGEEEEKRFSVHSWIVLPVLVETLGEWRKMEGWPSSRVPTSHSSWFHISRQVPRGACRGRCSMSIQWFASPTKLGGLGCGGACDGATSWVEPIGQQNVRTFPVLFSVLSSNLIIRDGIMNHVWLMWKMDFRHSFPPNQRTENFLFRKVLPLIDPTLNFTIQSMCNWDFHILSYLSNTPQTKTQERSICPL